MNNTSLIFFQRLYKHPPFFSKSYPIYNPERNYLKPISGYRHKFSLTKVHQYNVNQNKITIIYASSQNQTIPLIFWSSNPIYQIHKKYKLRLIFLQVYNNSLYKIMLPLGNLGDCEKIQLFCQQNKENLE